MDINPKDIDIGLLRRRKKRRRQLVKFFAVMLLAGVVITLYAIGTISAMVLQLFEMKGLL